jgi:N-acetylmuramoyl-L-alanine amidase
LAGYRGLALVSIHADSCEYINAEATGFKVAAALSSTNADRAQRLTACLRSRYEAITGLPFHSGSITGDMTRYHAFDEIHHETTAAIIETGFLNLDRQILTQSPEVIAEGITRGILCFIYNEDVTTQPGP